MVGHDRDQSSPLAKNSGVIFPGVKNGSEMNETCRERIESVGVQAPEDLCAMFEAINACTTLHNLAVLAVTSVSVALGCFSGGFQEIVYLGGASRLRRNFVSSSLEREVCRYIANFEKISASLLGGTERKDLDIFLMGSRIDSALEANFDPRPIWRGARIRDVLTMRVPLDDTVDVYFTFNRAIDSEAFGAADMYKARAVFSMISATSRRLFAEERFRVCGRAADGISEETILGAVGCGEARYLLSRIKMARQESPAIPCGRARNAEQANLAGLDEAVVFIRPSGDDTGIDRLTRSERAIATLAAQGHPNKDIAHQHSLSVYTVENHLKSVYRKLGISGRGRLAPMFLLTRQHG